MAERLKALDELGEEFERVASTPTSRRARPRRVLVLAVALAILAAAVALAATGVLTGEPVSNPPGVRFTPTTGVGTPLAGSAHLLDLRVPDPSGGAPWGMRTVRTTRGMGCAQIGRLVGGRLGVLGQDGAFSADGRFHEIPTTVLSQAECRQSDGAGHVFLAVSYQGMPASALPAGCAARPAPSTPSHPICPAQDERIIYYGLLGPHARSVIYDDDRGHTVTARTSGPDGAYLVVLRPSARHPARGYFAPGTSPASGLKSVLYRDGRVCRIRSPRALGGAKACPLIGYIAPRARRLTSAELAVPVHVTVAGTRLRISFRARVAADAHSYYIVTARPEHIRVCGFSASGGPVARDIASGEVVHDTLSIPSQCRGAIHVSVVLHQQRGQPDQLPFSGLPDHDPRVGTATVEVG